MRTQGRRAWLEGLLDGELTWVDRPVSCVRGGRLMRGRYLDQAPAAQTPDDLRGTALDWLGRRFPPGVIERVMRPYLEKIDGMALEQMPAGRVQRLAESQSAPEGWWFPLGGIVSKDANLAAQTHLADRINAGDLDPAPDQGPRAEGLRTFFTSLANAFPGVQVAEAPRRGRRRARRPGLHDHRHPRGDFHVIAPINRSIEVRGMQIGRFEDGRIVERWAAATSWRS